VASDDAHISESRYGAPGNKDAGQKTPGGIAIRDPEDSPGGASTTFTRTPKPEKSNQLQRLKPRLANTPCGRIKQLINIYSKWLVGRL
jgi:hypothetical protein